MDSRLNVVVLLADPARSEALGARLGEIGLHVITLREFGQFTAILNSERIDVLVLDHEFGRNQSGMQLLVRLKSELLHPATVLLSNVSEKELKDKNLPVHRTIPPDSSIDDIFKAVRRVIEAPRLMQEPIPLVARQLVQNFDGVKPLPQLLVKLSSYLGNIEEGSPTELAADISVDPRITAEVLKLTNSTALGLRHKVSRVVDAVNILGIRRTISLILASGVINSQRLAVKKLPDALRLWYYRRSVMIASTASVFAKTVAGVSPDSAYILGLLQEMGILVLAHAFENSYFRLLQRVREVGHLRLDFTERQEFQTTHAEASAALLQKWEMPPSMVSLVLLHHNPKGRTQSDAADQGFLQVMELAEAFANLSDSKTPQRHRLLAKCFEEFGPENLDKCRSSLVESVQKTVESSRLFSVPVPASDDLDELVERLASDAAEFEESDIIDDTSEPE
ncbi:MAG TPA: HDOD domain-containing protein, partial [Planctomycetaceae bacterium]|nr:HDOD domain-containing protein [Planctomycetaceae bacterium]